MDKVDKVFHRRYHIPVFQVCHIHSMNQILILYLEYVYVSFMDFFYVCHQRNAEGFFTSAEMAFSSGDSQIMSGARPCMA